MAYKLKSRVFTEPLLAFTIRNLTDSYGDWRVIGLDIGNQAPYF